MRVHSSTASFIGQIGCCVQCLAENMCKLSEFFHRKSVDHISRTTLT